MQSIIITDHPLHAQALYGALKRLNVDSICTRPTALKAWTPDTDAIIFLGRLHSKYYEYLLELVEHLHGDVPLIFLEPISKNFAKTFSSILDRCIHIDGNLDLVDLSHMIVDIMSSVFNHYLEEFHCGPLKLNRRFRDVEVLGKKVLLTKKEFYLLEILAQNLGRVTTRERIVDYVWDKRQFVAPNTIDVYISRLRKKMPKTELSPIIKTVPCLGYTLQLNAA